jgi:6-phosphofructokinase
VPHNYLSGRRSVILESCVSYHAALGSTVEMLDRIRTAAHDVGRIAVAEVPGYQSGWLALRAARMPC